MKKALLLTRAEIANALGCSERTVQRNEARWGLTRARADLNRRTVRYRRDKVVQVLEKFGAAEL